MQDRELLELAAKAAGLTWSKSKDITHDGLWLTAPWTQTYWNPLKEGADALWLAVKLEMEIEVSMGHAFARALHGSREGVSEFSNSDTESTLRRAIVRAAAEIGKGM
jgi:hypothetical protein